MACLTCNGEPYAAHDGERHIDICPECGACSGSHGGVGTLPPPREVPELDDRAVLVEHAPPDVDDF